MNKLIIRTNKKTKVIIENKMYDLCEEEYIECSDESDVFVLEYLEGNNLKMLFVDFALKEDNVKYPNKLYYAGEIVEIHLCIIEQKLVGDKHFVFGNTMVDILGGRNISVKCGEVSQIFSFFSFVSSIKKYADLSYCTALMLTLEDEKKYVIISSKNKIMVCECDKIEIYNGEIYVLHKTNNMLGVGVLSVFGENGSQKKSGLVEYVKREMVPNPNTLLSIFLQCLECGDLNRCDNYLSPNIKNIKIDTIKAYLGEYREYHQINPQIAILTYKTGDSHYYCKKLIMTTNEMKINSLELV